jgi:NAD(P)-dependent dehydrogenase (short-subunit alcohol dehydrogenase family)
VGDAPARLTVREVLQGDEMDLGLRGKWALVCGASKGLGWGCARALAQEGVHVVMAARGAEALEAAADALRAETGAQVLTVAADVTTEAGRAALFCRARWAWAGFRHRGDQCRRPPAR